MKISVVIPVYNSQETIGALGESLVTVLRSDHHLEIVLVNDCSVDQSEQECVKLFKKHPQIVSVFSLSKNEGEHNAVMAGLNHCHGDYVVIMDDDFQNPAGEVNKLIETIRSGDCDVVYSYYDAKKHSLFRNTGSWFNDKMANLMLKKPKHIYLSSFKIMNRFLVDQIIKYDLPFPYIDGLILRTTNRIGQVKVEHGPRRKGKSGYTLRKLVDLWLNTFTNFSVLPLRLSVVLGLVFSFIGLAFGIFTVVEKILNPSLPLGWASVAVSVSIFSGVQLIAIGLVGEYLGRVFLWLGKKPQYIIRQAYRPDK